MPGLGISLGLTGGGVVIGRPRATISITSGKGYGNSTYTSDIAGQWTADGVAIPGATGTTFRMTAALEGAVIRCGYSNGIQMWVPMLLPAAVKAGAAMWIPDLVAEAVDGKIARIPNILNPGWADQVQANAALRSSLAAADGRLALVNPTTEGPMDLGCISSHPVVMRHMFFLGRYKTGIEWTQGGRYPAVHGSRVRSTEGRIHGRSGSNNLEMNIPFRPVVLLKDGVVMPSEVNVPAYHPEVFPLNKSTLSIQTDTPPTYSPVMGMGDSDVSCWPGAIWASGVFPTVLSTVHAQLIEGYLRHRFNSGALPAGHAHRAAAPLIEYAA